MDLESRDYEEILTDRIIVGLRWLVIFLVLAIHLATQSTRDEQGIVIEGRVRDSGIGCRVCLRDF